MSLNSREIIREAQRKNIAFALETNDSIEQIITLGNQLVQENYNVTLFSLSNVESQTVPLFDIHQMSNIFLYSGTVLCFNLGVAIYLTKCGGQKRIFLVDQNMLWTQLSQYYYDTVADIYLNPRLQIITNSQNAKTIERIWKKPQIIEIFSVQELEKCCQLK